MVDHLQNHFVFNLYTCKEWVQVLSFAQLRNTQLFHSKCNYLKCRLTLKCTKYDTLKIRYIIFIWSMELRDDPVSLSLSGLVAELPFFIYLFLCLPFMLIVMSQIQHGEPFDNFFLVYIVYYTATQMFSPYCKHFPVYFLLFQRERFTTRYKSLNN